MGSKDCSKHSNLQCFLDRTTPVLPSRPLSKTSIRDLGSLWQPIGSRDTLESFTLGDLWDQYCEWSACGLGVPVRLAGGETVVQYYVPHLSAVQVYISKSLFGPRNLGEDSETDSWSDDSESEKLSKSWDAASEDSAFDSDGLWPAKDRIGQLYMQYVEYCPPFGRAPLVEKITELAKTYPGLMSLKSMELSPASWMSISWYPIYHIPARRTVKDLDASFLTFHTISSYFQDQPPEDGEKDGELGHAATESRNGIKSASKCVSLPPFGLATYRMHGDLWLNPLVGDNDRLVTLYSAADSWLKQLRVSHHDFNFFAAHSSM